MRQGSAYWKEKNLKFDPLTPKNVKIGTCVDHPNVLISTDPVLTTRKSP